MSISMTLYAQISTTKLSSLYDSAEFQDDDMETNESAMDLDDDEEINSSILNNPVDVVEEHSIRDFL
jgi:hypothetical protein